MTEVALSRLPKVPCCLIFFRLFLLDVRLSIFVVYYLFNRMFIQLKVPRIRHVRLNMTINFYLIVSSRPLTFGEVSEKGRCFDIVITMLKLADINVKPQRHSCEAPEEWQTPGTAPYWGHAFGSKTTLINFVYWMWGCYFSWWLLVNWICFLQRKVPGTRWINLNTKVSFTGSSVSIDKDN